MSARKRLLLISPPVLHAKSWWANRIANKPHLASLAGYVRDLAEVEILELDLDTSLDTESLLAEVDASLQDDVAMVGLSCWTSLHYLGTLAVAERVRALAPDAPIVIGGHHATAMPGDFNHDLCDWVVCGDGEHPLRQLCREWPRRPDAMQVLLGPVFDQSDPAHIDWASYGRPEAGERVLWVGLSRGCAFQCRFCIEPQRGASYSNYSVPDALRIIERLVETHAPRSIAFSDPLFGANRTWTREFLAGLAERQLPLMYWAQTRGDVLTPEILEGMKRCGFMLDVGLDTASETMALRMGKASNPARYLERSRAALEQADAIGLHHGVYLVFNFPGETPTTTQETCDFIDSLTPEGPTAGWLSAQTFFILPGTDAYLHRTRNAEEYGTEIHNLDWWRHAGDHYRMATDVLPHAQWSGQEERLRDFTTWNMEVNQRWASRYPADVARFRWRFYMG